MSVVGWSLWRCIAGDKNASVTKEERIAAAREGKLIERDPIHDFYIAVPEDANIEAPIVAAWERLGAKTPSDLPKPFDLTRVGAEVFFVDTKGRRKR